MANKEQGGQKNVKKVAKYSLKEKRALKREKKAHQGLSTPSGSGVFTPQSQ
ncbi:MAG: hypothetical protein PHH14_05320 [Candidatus Margulisbacteria bacterium]|nr:hypothetical protein [Candidatus Margulisiibacteriota bacterium]